MNPADELKEQYKDSHNLNARSQLHALFSTNKYGWMRWVFDQFDLPDNAAILELGCGNGGLWATNCSRVAPGWRLTLTDFSDGMLDAARQTLAWLRPEPSFRVMNAAEIDSEANQFDAVVANHMLYHVADLNAALRGIQRVLKPGGVLYATTNGETHMKELRDLAGPLAPDLPFVRQDNARSFGLENGQSLLGRHFRHTVCRLYEDSLAVTDPEPAVAWVLSVRGAQDAFGEEAVTHLRSTIAAGIASDGVFHITKSQGMLLAKKS